jgi:hypothetical protein
MFHTHASFALTPSMAVQPLTVLVAIRSTDGFEPDVELTLYASGVVFARNAGRGKALLPLVCLQGKVE